MVQGSHKSMPKVLTTGQVAKICNVAPRTVSKWFDLGQLRGYRIPGSRDRRVPLDQLIRFMKAHNMPLNGLDAGPRRVLLVQADIQQAQIIRQRLEQAGFEVQTAETVFEAGLQVERFRPHVVVLDVADNEAQAADIAVALRREPQFSDVKLVALESADAEALAETTPRRAFEARLHRPFNVAQLVTTLNEMLQ